MAIPAVLNRTTQGRRLEGMATHFAISADRGCSIRAGCDVTVDIGIAASNRVNEVGVGSDVTMVSG